MSPFWAVALVMAIVPPAAPRREVAALCVLSWWRNTSTNATANAASNKIHTISRTPLCGWRPGSEARILWSGSVAEGSFVSAVNVDLLFQLRIACIVALVGHAANHLTMFFVSHHGMPSGPRPLPAPRRCLKQTTRNRWRGHHLIDK